MSPRGRDADPRRAGPRRPRARGRHGRPTRGRTASASRPRGLPFGLTRRFRFGALPFLGPWHHRAQAGADLLDLVVLCGPAQLVETGSAGTAFGDPLFREHAVADVG